MILSASVSDIGLVRQNNEDVWAQVPDLHFFVLADGMGGHMAGEVAANQAVNTLCDLIAKNLDHSDETISLEEKRQLLIESIEEANALVFKMSRKDPELRGMGTTLCCLLFHSKGLVYGHVGDSRIYRLRGHKLIQLTKDHSLLRELIDLGEITEKQAGDFQYRNIITKAVGTEPSVDPSVRVTPINNGDIYMMCSDGLSDMLSLETMQEIMNSKEELPAIVDALLQAAKEKGGYDNITLVITKVLKKEETKHSSKRDSKR